MSGYVFTKMQGLGNDFMVLDGLTQAIHFTQDQVRAWSDRRTGVGFDQLLWLAPPSRPDCDAYYRIFNADGSEAEQCGNGARCVGRFLLETGLHTGRLPIRLQMHKGIAQVLDWQGDQVTISMGLPQFAAEQIPVLHAQSIQAQLITTQLTDKAQILSPLLGVTLQNSDINGQGMSLAVLSMGNPHAVVWVEDVDNAPVAQLGPLIQRHACFPQQVNVGFAQKVSADQIRLRVYERGSGETLACGSGACAAAVAGRLMQNLSAHVQVHQAGGVCQVEWSGVGSEVILQGPAQNVYQGRLAN